MSEEYSSEYLEEIKENPLLDKPNKIIPEEDWRPIKYRFITHDVPEYNDELQIKVPPYVRDFGDLREQLNEKWANKKDVLFTFQVDGKEMDLFEELDGDYRDTPVTVAWSESKEYC